MRTALISVDGIALDAVVHRPTAPVSAGTVIQTHGITADLDAAGKFVRLADRLADEGFTVLRFSYRGHGRSGGSQRGVTIAGEMLDLQAAVDMMAGRPGPLSIAAASFGAAPALLSLGYLEARLAGLVLWNPVLDLQHTFTSPQMPWGRANFDMSAQQRLREDGYLSIDGKFEIGRVLFEEMRQYRPDKSFAATTVPALVIQGDRDSYVSYDIAREAVAARTNAELYTVRGEGHGFGSREREDEVIDVTVDWLVHRHGSPR